MAGFNIKIICPDALIYDGPASFFKVRTIVGDIGVAGRHSNYFTMISAAECKIRIDEKTRTAACSGGFISIINEQVKVVVTTFEWADDLDEERVVKAYQKTKKILSDLNKDDDLYAKMYAKFKRAENRLNVIQKQEK